MRIEGEQSFPVYSAGSIVVIEHETRRLLRQVVGATYRGVHERKKKEEMGTMSRLQQRPSLRMPEQSVGVIIFSLPASKEADKPFQSEGHNEGRFFWSERHKLDNNASAAGRKVGRMQTQLAGKRRAD